MTDEEAIQAKLEDIAQHGAYRHYRPLSAAADEFVHWAAHPQERVYTGIGILDAAMRGTAPGETTLVQGFTHSGKTLLATEILVNNPDTPFIVFTPDETRPLVLTKLVAAITGVGAKELERRIQNDDETARQLMMETAERYGKLAIFDETVTLMDMDRMLDETTKALGCKPKAFMFDYADLLAGFDDVRGALTALKAWGKRNHLAAFVLHQASRTSGSSGRKMGIDSGAYGGEQQATHVIGVRRKKYYYLAAIGELEEKKDRASNPNSIAEYESKIRTLKDDMLFDENTITVSLNKNKRPPCDLVDDQDFQIDKDTGRMSGRSEMFEDESGKMVRVTKSSLAFLRSEKNSFDREMEF